MSSNADFGAVGVEMPHPTPVSEEEKPDYLRSAETAMNPNPNFDPDAQQKTEPRRRVSLGDNRKRASGVRQLTKKDLDQLHGLYAAVGMGTMPFHKRGAQAVMDNAETCVNAWEELAKQNDSVRRALLMVLEGGAWGIVLTAHLPIALAFVPEHVMRNMPLLFGQDNGADQEEEHEESDQEEEHEE